MYRTGVQARAALRSSQSHLHSSLAPARTAGRRYLTTAPPHKTSRSWKNSALRWGLAAGGLYYYNTSPVFAEYPQNNLLNPNVDALTDDGRDHSTLEQLTASSRNKSAKNVSTLQSTIERSSEDLARQEQEKPSPSQPRDSQSLAASNESPAQVATGGAAELEQEAQGEGAFNPVTGEINWDCPCLGGMAYGPCGEQFRNAFSCFVYSNEEPKGMECIEKFQAMQDCFRAHPEVYATELEDDESLDGELAQEKEELRKEIAERREAIEKQQAAEGQKSKSNIDTSDKKPQDEKNTSSSQQTSQFQAQPHRATSDSPQPEAKTTSHTPAEYSQPKESAHGAPSQTISEPAPPTTSINAQPESESLVPKAAHDASTTTIEDSEGGKKSKA
ncbi:Oxidoreductase [Lithohypha guttulata]|uniref:Mitochondrial intermembrane space import and assembly protein 40 n=1 Tax=Lithohypha guttulata TaxID=1690604 RepID=A0AAN7YH66_9EURO|nr:Oxidoreductase [Lithohypha guttulata]KAK5097138.1 Oxidoreductase [Lithohypha guttulata]